MYILSFHVTNTLNSLHISTSLYPLTSSACVQSLSCYVFRLAAISRYQILRVQYQVVGEVDRIICSSLEWASVWKEKIAAVRVQMDRRPGQYWYRLLQPVQYNTPTSSEYGTGHDVVRRRDSRPPLMLADQSRKSTMFDDML